MHTEAMREYVHCSGTVFYLCLQVHLKLQKILVSFSERLKRGFIKGRTVYKSFRWGDVYYSEELMVCACWLKCVF